MDIGTIRRFLDQPDCVIFVGSGISLWSGLPTWPGLLHELADFLDAEGLGADLVRREIENRDLLQAASFGFSKLTPPAIKAFMRKAMRVGIAQPHEIHQHIVELGPNFFITTNYDRLIEQALAKWKPDAHYPSPVTNRHLSEIPEILGARASNFIFKPHGDIDDAASIILTHEQYRQLLPQGTYHRALDALKTLLVSRPVLFLGFGLRDPDFIHVRNLLVNIYEGAPRDHWAILPDIDDDEIVYWRQQYGIRLGGYRTRKRSDGSSDHVELLEMLRALRPAKATMEAPKARSQAETVLALTRYTAALTQKLAPEIAPVDLTISAVRNDLIGQWKFEPYDHWTATRFLKEGPGTAYLIGLPGAGKSFAFRVAASELSAELQRACINDSFDSSALRFPIWIDLKLYRGDLRALVDAALPAGFTLALLLGTMRLKLFLDAFNEMPPEYIEDASLFGAIDALRAEFGEIDIAISSRTLDGLRRSESDEAAIYEIDRFDSGHVSRILAEKNVELIGSFADDIHRMLCRPFFLQLVLKDAVDVPDNARPRDIYASFAAKLDAVFQKDFATNASLTSALSQTAFRAINEACEAFPLGWLRRELSGLSAIGDEHADAVVNWLVSRDVLISYSGQRASLVHQSITEYYAALELARRSVQEQFSVQSFISSKKWDQCLFLALGLMNAATADAILDQAIRYDLGFAINASRFAEEGQSEVVSRILETIIERIDSLSSYHLMTLNFRILPVEREHLPLLRQLVQFGDHIGGEAVRHIAAVEGRACKDELFDLLDTRANDFNFATIGVPSALESLIEDDDLPRLISIGLHDDGDKNSHRSYMLRDLLAKFDPDAVVSAMENLAGVPLPSNAVAVLCESLARRDDQRAHTLLTSFLITHPIEAATQFYFSFRRHHQDNPAHIPTLDKSHAHALWAARGGATLWSDALRQIVTVQPHLHDVVMDLARHHRGVERISLLHCAVAPNDEIFAEVNTLATLSDDELTNEPFTTFNLKDLDWHGHEQLYVDLLRRNLEKVNESLFGGSTEPSHLRPGVLGLEGLRPLIDQGIARLAVDGDTWASRMVGGVVAHLADNETDAFCLSLALANEPSARRWFKAAYLPERSSITLEMLEEPTILDLIEDLETEGLINEFWYNPLGRLATEEFVAVRLLPLVAGSSPARMANLRTVLTVVGERFGRRYMIDYDQSEVKELREEQVGIRRGRT